MRGRYTQRISDAFAQKGKTRRVSEEQVDEIARRVATVIKGRLEGEELQVETWTNVCQALGARVKTFRSSVPAPGFYQGSGVQPAIYYNILADEPERIRCLIHELAHHVLATWPDTTFPRTSQETYDDDRNSVQHRIARRVEYLLLDLAQES